MEASLFQLATFHTPFRSLHAIIHFELKHSVLEILNVLVYV